MHFLGTKYAKNAFAARAYSGGAYSARPGGPTSKGRGTEMKRVGEKRWRGKEGEGSYGYFFFPTSSPEDDIITR